jgi:hypothetical protein
MIDLALLLAHLISARVAEYDLDGWTAQDCQHRQTRRVVKLVNRTVHPATEARARQHRTFASKPLVTSRLALIRNAGDVCPLTTADQIRIARFFEFALGLGGRYSSLCFAARLTTFCHG